MGFSLRQETKSRLGRIINAEDSSDKYPWMAKVYLSTQKRIPNEEDLIPIAFFCTASIINHSRYVTTKIIYVREHKQIRGISIDCDR